MLSRLGSPNLSCTPSKRAQPCQAKALATDNIPIPSYGALEGCEVAIILDGPRYLVAYPFDTCTTPLEILGIVKALLSAHWKPLHGLHWNWTALQG